MEKSEAFIDGFSGAAGGMVSTLLLYPIDNFRTRVQALGANKGDDDKGLKQNLGIYQLFKKLVQQEGYSSFYKGLNVALIGNVVAYGVYFWWYRFLKNIFSPNSEKFTNSQIMVITAIAGCISSLATNPIWMLNTRVAIRKKSPDSKGRLGVSGLVDLIKEITRTEGLSAFYKGALPNLVLVINPIINFVIYERLRYMAKKAYRGEDNIPVQAIFVLSSIGKIIATLCTYPILTIRVR